MTSSGPTDADRQEAESMWASIQHSESLPPLLLSLISQKNMLLKTTSTLSNKRDAPVSPDILVPTKKPRTPVARKKKFEKWANALLREAPKVKFWYHEDTEKHCVVKETSAMKFEDFEELFGVCGKNTAKSRKAVIQSREYANLDEVKELFGLDTFPELVQVKQWKKRPFGKSCVVDELDVPVLGMTAKYNRTKMTCEMLFRLEVVM